MISADGFCCMAGAFLLLVLPLDWVLSAVTAALVHEFSHILAVMLLGGKILKIRVSVTGCQIETLPMGELKRAVCILAGPVGSFLLLLFRRKLPQIAAFGFFQGVYNCLPVMPLDGGRLLGGLLSRICPDRTEQVMLWIRICLCAGLVLVGIALMAYYKMDIVIMISYLLFNIGWGGRKIPCKENRIGLQ